MVSHVALIIIRNFSYLCGKYDIFLIFVYEGEIKSVYVRNLPSTVSASEVEEEFKHFGKLSSDGVVIRSRKVFRLYIFSVYFFVPVSNHLIG